MKTDTKLTIVMWCRVLIRSTQHHLAAVSAGYQLASSLSTCLGNSGTARPALDLQKPVQAKQRAFYYVYQKGCVFPPIKILSDTLHIRYYTLHTTQYTLHTSHLTIHTLYCTPYTIHHMLHIIHYTICNNLYYSLPVRPLPYALLSLHHFCQGTTAMAFYVCLFCQLHVVTGPVLVSVLFTQPYFIQVKEGQVGWMRCGLGQSRPHVATAETNKRGDLLLWNRSQGGVGGVLDHMGNSADQISLPWVIMEGKYCYCYSTKAVEYYPDVCIIDNCLEYLYTI